MASYVPLRETRSESVPAYKVYNGDNDTRSVMEFRNHLYSVFTNLRSASSERSTFSVAMQYAMRKNPGADRKSVV